MHVWVGHIMTPDGTLQLTYRPRESGKIIDSSQEKRSGIWMDMVISSQEGSFQVCFGSSHVEVNHIKTLQGCCHDTHGTFLECLVGVVVRWTSQNFVDSKVKIGQDL